MSQTFKEKKISELKEKIYKYNCYNDELFFIDKEMQDELVKFLEKTIDQTRKELVIQWWEKANPNKKFHFNKKGELEEK